ncbi:MAG: hypothetical protein AB7S26_14275 [Sandaracinaceae bacterium]
MSRLVLLSVCALAIGCTQRASIGSFGGDAAVAVDGGPRADAGASCGVACGHFRACFGDEILSQCLEACDDPDAAELVLACDAMADGCDYPAMCRPPDGMSDCVSNCETAGFFDCIADADVARCVDACGTATPAQVQQFNSCSIGGCMDDGCYRILVPEGSRNVAGCQSACDDMVGFDCIYPIEHTDCRERCTRATREAINTFIACAAGICSGPSCYDELVFATP